MQISDFNVLNLRIVCLSDDSQTWTFSAPERAAVFHFSLWINAVCLALVLGAFAKAVPMNERIGINDHPRVL